MGGTFDRIHVGHEALLAAAFDHAGEVGIGITTDEFLRKAGPSGKARSVRPFEERRQGLERRLEELFPGRSWYLIPLVDRWGAALEPSTQALVVSDETLAVGERANQLRRLRRIRPLTLIVRHAVLGEDLLRVSSTRLRQGRIDRDGRRLTPVRVGVGSTNAVKRAGVEVGFHTLFERTPIQLEAVSPGKPNPQPWGLKEGFAGAHRRAALALEAGCDWGVGVEATVLLLDPKGSKKAAKGSVPGTYDVHCVAVAGADGTRLSSLSAAYPLPPGIASVLEGRRTLEDAVRLTGGPAAVGHTTGGALSYLTGNAISREGVIAEAVRAAFVPLLARRAERLPAVDVLRPSRR